MFGAGLLLLTIGLSVYGSSIDLNDPILQDRDWSQFNQFVERFHKEYYTFDDLVFRFGVFKNNLRTIIQHNLSRQNFTLAVNQFSDYTLDEYKFQLRKSGVDGLNRLKQCKTYETGAGVLPTRVASKTGLPESIDWRQLDAVTPVKNQGQCGSCWAFSSAGAMEGAWAIHSGNLVSLSEQQLVDCSGRYGNKGCNGGMMDNAFLYAMDKGMCSELEYEYTASVDACVSCTIEASFSSCMNVPERDPIALQNAVFLNPVSVAIEADTFYFQSYGSGVLTDTKCGTNLDHGVLVVGYGVDNDLDVAYWIVKNSWGPDWGEEGYIRIQRDVNGGLSDGICGINLMASFPIV